MAESEGGNGTSGTGAPEGDAGAGEGTDILGGGEAGGEGAGTAEGGGEGTDILGGDEGDGEGAGGDANPHLGAPESYEAFTLPEGVSMTDEARTALETQARTLGLSQQGAQALLDSRLDAVRAHQEANDAEWRQVADSYTEQTRNDPELGGNNLAETVRFARAGIDALARNATEAQQARAVLKHAHLSNYAPLVAMFARAGRMLAEDSVSRGDGTGAGSDALTGPGARRFPNQGREDSPSA